MHHKRRRPWAARAGCAVCKPNKHNTNKTADRMRARRGWLEYELFADEGEPTIHPTRTVSPDAPDVPSDDPVDGKDDDAMTLSLPAPAARLRAPQRPTKTRADAYRHATIARMIEPQSAFDVSLARVVAADRCRDTDPSSYERAWTAFWNEHYEPFLAQARAYAAGKKGLANHLHTVEEELITRTLKRIASGKEINRKVLFGIRSKVIATVWEHVNRLERQDVFERLVQRMHDTGISEAAQRQLRERIEQVIAEYGAGRRSTLKSDILTAILTEDVFKKNGEISLAEIARQLDRPAGTVRREFQEACLDIQLRFPDLADLLVDDEQRLDAEFVTTVPKEGAS